MLNIDAMCSCYWVAYEGAIVHCGSCSCGGQITTGLNGLIAEATVSEAIASAAAVGVTVTETDFGVG